MLFGESDANIARAIRYDSESTEQIVDNVQRLHEIALRVILERNEEWIIAPRRSRNGIDIGEEVAILTDNGLFLVGKKDAISIGIGDIPLDEHDRILRSYLLIGTIIRSIRRADKERASRGAEKFVRNTASK